MKDSIIRRIIGNSYNDFASDPRMKLSQELVADLVACVTAFRNLNKASTSREDIFKTILIALLSFDMSIIHWLANSVEDSQRSMFLRETEKIFTSLMKELNNHLKKQENQK